MREFACIFLIGLFTGMPQVFAAEPLAGNLEEGPVAEDEASALDRRPQSEVEAVEQHARRLFRGVFSQCRNVEPSDASGAVVSLVFEVQPSGHFSATVTFHRSDGTKEAVRQLAECMGQRANRGQRFPSFEGSTLVVGAKYALDQTDAGGKTRLILAAGDVALLASEQIFAWTGSQP